MSETSITIPDYAIEEAAKAAYLLAWGTQATWPPHNEKVGNHYVDRARQEITAALTEMVKRGDAELIEATPERKYSLQQRQLIITLQEPT